MRRSSLGSASATGLQSCYWHCRQIHQATGEEAAAPIGPKFEQALDLGNR